MSELKKTMDSIRKKYETGLFRMYPQIKILKQLKSAVYENRVQCYECWDEIEKNINDYIIDSKLEFISKSIQFEILTESIERKINIHDAALQKTYLVASLEYVLVKEIIPTTNID